jgi:hypothetical protein
MPITKTMLDQHRRRACAGIGERTQFDDRNGLVRRSSNENSYERSLQPGTAAPIETLLRASNDDTRPNKLPNTRTLGRRPATGARHYLLGLHRSLQVQAERRPSVFTAARDGTAAKSLLFGLAPPAKQRPFAGAPGPRHMSTYRSTQLLSSKPRGLPASVGTGAAILAGPSLGGSVNALVAGCERIPAANAAARKVVGGHRGGSHPYRLSV